jgi:cytochrome c-type biogenesis protein CcmH/NrfG
LSSPGPASKRSGRKRPAPSKPVSEQLQSSRGIKIGIFALALLFSCSLLAGALVAIPIDELFGFGDEDQGDNFVDPNNDLIEDQRALVEDNPDDLDATLLLANLLGNTGQLNEAIPYFEAAIALAPDDPSVRLDFARALADGQLQRDAELQFQKVLQVDPDNQSALFYLGELYMQWQPAREQEAQALFEKSVRIDPDSFIGSLAQDQLDSISGTPASEATPVGSPAS